MSVPEVSPASTITVALVSADAILAYRPIDVVDRISPRALMLIAVEGDAVTPEDHALALYGRAGGPKRLLLQTGTTHYDAYAQYRDMDLESRPLLVLRPGRVVSWRAATAASAASP